MCGDCGWADTPTGVARYCDGCSVLFVTKRRFAGVRRFAVPSVAARATDRESDYIRVHPQAGVPQLSNRRPRSSRREDSRKWEQFLLTTATDRIVEAILKHGNGSLFQRPSGCRVDLRTQVISRAPRGRLAIDWCCRGHCARSDSPKLTPKPSQARASSWYSLTPFEYPDDLRLRDGSLLSIDLDRCSPSTSHRTEAGESIPVPVLLPPSPLCSKQYDGKVTQNSCPKTVRDSSHITN